VTSRQFFRQYGIYVSDEEHHQHHSPGPTLCGKTVNSFELGRDAINDSGQITFWVSFTDNTSAIVRTTGVPELAAAVLCLPAGLAFLQRGRRFARS
jgi:hypothetical protein